MDEQSIRKLIREELADLIKSDRYTINKLMQFQDGGRIQTGRTNGLKIGNSTSDKIGFWNTAPVIQPAHANQGALSLFTSLTGGDTIDRGEVESNFSDLQSFLTEVRNALVNTGIIKGSA